jgi:hypothetical protein
LTGQLEPGAFKQVGDCPEAAAASKFFEFSYLSEQVSGIPDTFPMPKGVWPEGWRLALSAHVISLELWSREGP